MYTLYLGFRYAMSRIANYVAIVAIALAVLVQIVVMSVLDGVLLDIKDRVQGMGEQITIGMPLPGVEERVYRDIAQSVTDGIPAIRGVTPVLSLYGLVTHNGMSHPAMIRGIDLAGEMQHGQLASMLLDTTKPQWSDTENEGIILGAALATSLGITSTTATITLEYAEAHSEKLIRRTLPVTSRFRSGISYFDEHIVYIPLALAQQMRRADGAAIVDSAAIWLDDPAAAPALRDAVIAATEPILRREHAYDFTVQTWQDSFGSMFQAIAHENMLQQVVMAFISFSGAFCIFAIMYMLVSARIRDIGILRSLGATRRGVASIFLFSGFLMGTIGAIAGTIGGILLAPNVDTLWKAITGEPLYPPYLFLVDTLPIYLDPFKIALYACSAVIVSTCASLPAAWYASHRPPLEALRHE